MRYRYGVVLLVVQAILTYFSFPNAQISEANVLSAILVLFASAPLFILILAYRGKQLAWFAGLSFVAASVPAILHTANMSQFPIIGILILALIAIIIGSLGSVLGMVARSFYEKTPWAFLLLAPALVTSQEYLRTALVLHLWFVPPPTILYAYPLVGIPPLIQMSSITGVFGPGFLAYFISAAIALVSWIGIIKNPTYKKVLGISDEMQPLDSDGKKKQWRTGLGVGLVMVCLIVAGNIEAIHISKLQNTAKAVIKPAMLQLQIDPSAKINWNNQFRSFVLGKYRAMFEEARQKQADVIVLTENALPVVLPRDMETWQAFLDLLSEFRLPAFAGVVTTPEENLSFDTWYWLDRAGKTRGYYNKRFLEPFGEYMPMRSVIDPTLDGFNYLFRKSYRYLKITAMPNENYDLSSGKEEKIFLPVHNAKVSLKVCIEIIIGQYFRESVKQGAQVFLSPSTSNWFITPEDWNLGVLAACFRAVETRRWVGRHASMAGNAAIDALGIVRASTPFGERAVLVASMPLLDYKSFYVRFGDVFSWLCLSICLLFGGFLLIKRKN